MWERWKENGGGGREEVGNDTAAQQGGQNVATVKMFIVERDSERRYTGM